MEDLKNNTEVEVEVEIELPYTIPLKKPISIRSRVNGEVVKTIDSITFQNDLTAKMVGHFRPAKDGTMPMSDFYPVISQMTGELPATVDKLSFPDVQEAIGVVSYFLADGQSTGDSL